MTMSGHEEFNGRHILLDSRAMGRRVHLWCFGHYGPPLVVFPTAGGYAHEWQLHGMVETLGGFLRAGRLKLYCPETNVSAAWLGESHPVEVRVERHLAYARFVEEDLLPFIDADCQTANIPVMSAGASLGAYYASLFTLRMPQRFRWALCLSGRYEISYFLGGYSDARVDANNPLMLARTLDGEPLAALRQHGRLTLVCGRGPYEERCIDETLAMAELCQERGIPHDRDIWGHDVAHAWSWWQRQAYFHLAQRLA
jgi:esterase/lipase superfamily enzyme